MALRILLVEDEEKLLSVMALFLRAEGFEIAEAQDGETALKLFPSFAPNLVILDAMLPGISGFDVCSELRKTSSVPIIFLTALSDDDHHMLGYRLGADDYIAKPFKISILAMKAKRMLQRTEIAQRHEHRYAGIVLDTDAYKCYVNDEEVTLTQKEFVLLSEFMKNPGRVLTREWLLEQIWGYDFSGETRVVDTMVKNLRKKLGVKAHLIHTVISVGYKLEDTK